MPTAYPLSAHNAWVLVEVDFRGGSIWIDKDSYEAQAHESFSYHR
jgi:hypothetical protein